LQIDGQEDRSMAKVDTLQALFVEELRDLLDAEKQLVRTLPKLARKASSETLAAAFRAHLEQTRQHVSRLQQAFERLGLRASSKKCVGMQGLIEDGQESIGEAEDGPVRDAALIAAAQRAEHYEMSGYGTARTFATLLGHAEVASLLERSLEDEKAADLKLTGIAEALVNPDAADEEPSDAQGESFAARTAAWLGSTAGAAVSGVGRLAGRFTGAGTRKTGARRSGAAGRQAQTKAGRASTRRASAPARPAKTATRARPRASASPRRSTRKPR
jgi:ferritin-like metal-binding protein YciE